MSLFTGPYGLLIYALVVVNLYVVARVAVALL